MKKYAYIVLGGVGLYALYRIWSSLPSKQKVSATIGSPSIVTSGDNQSSNSLDIPTPNQLYDDLTYEFMS